MGDFANRGRTVPCKWCNRPVVQDRRWFPRQYCGRWHKVKHRVTEIFGDVLGGGA
ncbi:hypothetical protein [Streptomyces roseolilacinus]|uniref:Uncharacterized protein n=1 Tax=Streptomyces roseolilacinus TaxID=66904 RepID=A0A918ELT5_9ACTN|nr:hypothetical protein [Streptomyces roseolilacinus]GGQ10705.1 hypothetical protein GCM10010249_31460 [Streptomyces roseolilacinus]